MSAVRFFAMGGPCRLLILGDRGGRGGVIALRRMRRQIGDILPVMTTQLERQVVVKRAGVRLFICDAKLREKVQYFVGLYFQLPRQLVNSDLSHR